MTVALVLWGAVATSAAVWALVTRRTSVRDVARHKLALSRSVEKLEQIERSFQRFAPLELVEQIAQGVTTYEPSIRSVTIMFADLQGFTPLSEKIEPTVMVRMLNGYFRAMNEAITRHHGHLARLMGDGLMALFGATEDNPWHAIDAVKASLAMREALERYNAELVADGLPRLAFGVGINTGEVVAGVMGSDRLVEFTVIGDPVNLAARIEALTRTHGVDILITESVRTHLDERFALEAMPAATVKGKSEPIVTYVVRSFTGPSTG